MCLITGLQAQPFQEIYEKVQCGMVGLLIPADRPCSSFHRICTRGEREHCAHPDDSSIRNICFSFHWSDGVHFAQH